MNGPFTSCCTLQSVLQPLTAFTPPRLPWDLVLLRAFYKVRNGGLGKRSGLQGTCPWNVLMWTINFSNSGLCSAGLRFSAARSILSVYHRGWWAPSHGFVITEHRILLALLWILLPPGREKLHLSFRATSSLWPQPNRQRRDWGRWGTEEKQEESGEAWPQGGGTAWCYWVRGWRCVLLTWGSLFCSPLPPFPILH